MRALKLLKINRYFTWLLLPLVISGCSLLHNPLRSIDNWDDYQRRLAATADWQLRGKITVKVPEESESAKVFWQNALDHYQIRLSGPLGQGATWIKGEPGQVRLEQAGEPVRVARSAEELIAETLDLELPISDLHYWVRGIPAPYGRIRKSTRDEANNLASLEQAGWQLSYSRYKSVGQWNLPGRVIAERDDIKLTQVISNWSMGLP